MRNPSLCLCLTPCLRLLGGCAQSATSPASPAGSGAAGSPPYVSSLVDDVKTETHKLELLRLEQQKVLSQVRVFW